MRNLKSRSFSHPICDILFLFFIVLSGGCNGPVQGLYPPTRSDADPVVYLASNHFHTGLVFRLEDMSPVYRKAFSTFHDFRYVEVGWGNDLFYRSRDPSILTGVMAATCSPRGVVHVAGISPSPEVRYLDYEGELYRIRLSQEGYDALVKYVCQTLDTDENGMPVEVQDGLYAFSRFYRAHGTYCVMHTCNHWTADGLREAGFPVTPMYAFTADNLCMQVRVRGAKYQNDLVVIRQ